ncbi:MAG TPA: hypothetical protein VHQ01_02965, partial [Pyrinomonadaceae bacterium]|nr:hypothetical protein [Pyrinomonadaceae bacterium]
MSNDFNVSSTVHTKNHILNSLPKDSLDRLLPHMVAVEMESGKILYKSQETIGYVYFPLDSMVSVVAVAISGQSAEVGVIGSEGMVGIDALMGADSALNDNMVQLPNGALRIKLSLIREEFDRA